MLFVKHWSTTGFIKNPFLCVLMPYCVLTSHATLWRTRKRSMSLQFQPESARKRRKPRDRMLLANYHWVKKQKQQQKKWEKKYISFRALFDLTAVLPDVPDWYSTIPMKLILMCFVLIMWWCQKACSIHMLDFTYIYLEKAAVSSIYLNLVTK